jgi:hypothetical protein
MSNAIGTHKRCEADGMSRMIVIACDLLDDYGREMARINTEPENHPDYDVWFFALSLDNWNTRFPFLKIPDKYKYPVVIVSGPQSVIVECYKLTRPTSIVIDGIGNGKSHTMEKQTKKDQQHGKERIDVMNDAEKHILPLRSIERPEIREQMKRADIIIGVDTAQNDFENCFWGRAAHRKIINSKEPKALTVMRFRYDQNTEELEYLCAAVKVLKGSCSYIANDKKGSTL